MTAGGSSDSWCRAARLERTCRTKIRQVGHGIGKCSGAVNVVVGEVAVEGDAHSDPSTSRSAIQWVDALPVHRRFGSMASRISFTRAVGIVGFHMNSKKCLGVGSPLPTYYWLGVVVAGTVYAE